MMIIENLTKQFGNQTLYTGLNLSFSESSLNILTGPSGCGKTTLLRIIAGLDKDYTGTLKNIPMPISYVFQEDRLIPWLNVEENIHFVLKNVMDKEAMTAITEHILHKVQLYEDRHKLPKALSGGMQRRTSIARAFAYPSRLLLLDEPFNGLDEALKFQLIEDFLELQSDKQIGQIRLNSYKPVNPLSEPHKVNLEDNYKERTCLLVTHDRSVIERTAGKVYTL